MPQRQPTQGLVGPRLAALASGGNIPSPPARHGELVLIADAQREIRQGYIGGFMGQLVSGVLWLVTAAFATWARRGQQSSSSSSAACSSSRSPGLALRRSVIALRSLRDPLNGLAMQVAFTLPLSLPVVGAAALYRLDWFFPAFMVILGAHYLPFVFLYGMRLFAVLCAFLASAGLGLALYAPPSFSAGAWVTAGLPLAFAFAGRRIARREASAHPMRPLRQQRPRTSRSNLSYNPVPVPKRPIQHELRTARMSEKDPAAQAASACRTLACHAGLLSREMPLAPVRHSADRRRVRERYEGPRSRRTGRARFDRIRLCPRLSWRARARRAPLHSPC